jgi:CRP-like cAMP-binding protein
MNFPDDSFLGSLTPTDLEALLAAGTKRRYEPGELLCREGDAPAAVVVVLDGTVKLTKTSMNGREALLELRGRGDVLGDMSVVDSGPQSANAVAVGAVDALVIGARAFSDLRSAGAGIANALLRIVVGRLRQASDRQLELGTDDVVSRVSRRLVELSVRLGEDTPGGVLVRGGISQQDLADWSGVSRDGVVRTMQALRDAAIVESGRSQVLIKDLAGLRRKAGLPPAAFA